MAGYVFESLNCDAKHRHISQLAKGTVVGGNIAIKVEFTNKVILWQLDQDFTVENTQWGRIGVCSWEELVFRVHICTDRIYTHDIMEI